jgi:hypothetical protein
VARAGERVGGDCRGVVSSLFVQKGELLTRLSRIVERLRGAPAHSPELVQEMRAIEQALIPLEAELAAAIDRYLANKYETSTRVTHVVDRNGLSGRWGQRNHHRRKGSA